MSRWQSISRRAATTLLAGRLDDAADLASGPSGSPRTSATPTPSGSATSSAGNWPASPRACHLPSAPPRLCIAGYDLWFPAIAAEAAARCGSDQLRGDLYQLLAPYSGNQVGCGAWVAYCGAVDYYLGLLAAARADHIAAAGHLDAATAQHLRLGAPRWAALSRQQQDRQQHHPNGRNRFRRDGTVWAVAYDGVQAHVPHVKGVHDIAVLLAHPGQPVSASDLAGTITRSRGEPALDRQALAAYRARLRDLDDDIAEADSHNDPERAARARTERDALVAELTRSLGRGGRPRRLGDDTEKARKTVTIRIQRALRLLDSHHPALASHLREAVRTGTTCSYQPARPFTWEL